jgi:hypothetical protein
MTSRSDKWSNMYKLKETKERAIQKKNSRQYNVT